MKVGKVVSRVVVYRFPLIKQRAVDNVRTVPPFGFNDQGEEPQLVVDQARSRGNRASWVADACSGRTQHQFGQGRGGGVEMDNETYQTTKIA